MATPNVVPRANTEGGLGTIAKSWGKLRIQSSASLAGPAGYIKQFDVDQDGLHVDGGAITSGNCIYIPMSSVTSGKGFYVLATSALATSGRLMKTRHWDQSPGSVVTVSNELQYYTNVGVTGGNSATKTNLKLEMTNINGGNSGTINHTSVYNDMYVINNGGLNDNSNITQYAIHNKITLGTVANNVGLYSEIADGGMDVKFVSSADTGDFFSIATGAAGATTITTVDDDGANADLTFNIDGSISIGGVGGIVFNEDGADADFRIESDDETHMFFLDASTNRISIGDSVDDPAATLEITNNASAGAYNVPLVQLNNNDDDQITLDINSSSVSADIIDIVSSTLKSGSIIKGTVLNNNTELSNVHGFMDFNWSKTGNTGDGEDYIITGGSIEIVDLSSSNHANSTVTQTGLDILIDSSSTTGTNTNTGIEIDVTDATTNYGLDITAEDGAGADIILRSSADDGDIFSIATGAAGATTITTVDDDAAAAHLTFNIDGDFIVNSADFSINGAGEITSGTWDGSTITVPSGGTGATSLAADCILTGNGTSAITAETYLTFTNSSNISTLSVLSNQDTGDLFKIETTTAGATTLTTTDDDANAAHFKIDVDGDYRVWSASKQIYWGTQGGGGTDVMNLDSNAGTLKIMSTNNANDYLTINVAAEGATTLTTVDADTAAAHFEVAADGNITLDAAGDVAVEAAGGDLTVGDGSVNYFTFKLDATPEIDVVGNFKLDGAGTVEIESGTTHDITIDAGDDINLDANDSIHLVTQGNNALVDKIQFGKTDGANVVQRTSFGAGMHRLQFTIVFTLATTGTDNTVYYEVPLAKIPAYSHIVRASAVAHVQSTISTFKGNISLSSTSGTSLGQAVAGTVQEIIGAGNSDTRSSDSGSPSDIAFGAGATPQKVWWSYGSGVTVGANDMYIYLLNAGTNNNGTSSRGHVHCTIDYYGID